MPDPIDISTFPRAFDPESFTPAEAEAYDRAWQARVVAVRDLAAAMRGGDPEAWGAALGPALATVNRCNAIEEAATERIRRETEHADAIERVWPGTSPAAPQLVIGPPVDGDRASEDDLAQRGAYAGDEGGPTVRVPQSDGYLVGVWRYASSNPEGACLGPFLGYDDPIVSGRDLSAAVEKLEEAIEADGYGGLVDAARALVQLHRGIPR